MRIERQMKRKHSPKKKARVAIIPSSKFKIQHAFAGDLTPLPAVETPHMTMGDQEPAHFGTYLDLMRQNLRRKFA